MFNTFSVNTSAFSYAVAPHLALPPPYTSPPVLLPHAEACTMSLWTPWFESTAPTVHFDGSPAVQLGHDVGFGIPHVSAPNPLLAAVIAFSKCQVHFGKSTVLAAGKPAGYWLPGVAMFQVCADPFSLPLGFNVAALLGTTVKFGFSWGDQFAGQVRVGIDIAISRLVGGLYGKIAQKYVTRAVDRLVANRVSHVIEAAIEPFTNRTSKKLSEDAIEAFIRRARALFKIEEPVHEAIDRLASRGLNKLFDKLAKWGAKPVIGDLRWLGPAIDSEIDAQPPVLDESHGLLDEVPMLEDGEDEP